MPAMHKIGNTILLVILASCGQPIAESIDPGDLRFDMSEASELFFANVRKHDYLLEEMREARINLYRPKDLEEDTLSLSPCLIINWRADKAFVMLEANSSPDSLLLEIIGIRDTVLAYTPGNPMSHTGLSANIYNAILSGDTVYLKRKGRTRQPLFRNRSQKESFRRLFYDYLRLVEVR